MVFGLTRPGTEPESTASVADATDAVDSGSVPGRVKPFRGPSQGQGQPFQGQNLSRPRLRMAISEYRILRTGSIFRIRFDHRTKLRTLNLRKLFLSLRNANLRVCVTPSSSLQYKAPLDTL